MCVFLNLNWSFCWDFCEAMLGQVVKSRVQSERANTWEKCSSSHTHCGPTYSNRPLGRVYGGAGGRGGPARRSAARASGSWPRSSNGKMRTLSWINYLRGRYWTGLVSTTNGGGLQKSKSVAPPPQGILGRFFFLFCSYTVSLGPSPLKCARLRCAWGGPRSSFHAEPPVKTKTTPKNGVCV